MKSDRVFTNQHFYHIYNRGVAKQTIFQDDTDYYQFLRSLSFYLEEPPFPGLSAGKKRPDELNKYLASSIKQPLVVIHAYCLMPNHIHLLIEQIADGGLSKYMRRVLLSYTRYYNTRYDRVGPLFQGTFKAAFVENDQQLLHLSRYIHLNSFVAKLSSAPHSYPWSSLPDYYAGRASRLCSPEFLLKIVGSPNTYRTFIEDYASYAQDLHVLKHTLIDN